MAPHSVLCLTSPPKPRSFRAQNAENRAEAVLLSPWAFLGKNYSVLSRYSPERINHGQRGMRAPSCHQRLKEPIKGCADMKRITHLDPSQTQISFYKEGIYSSEILDGLRGVQHSTTQAKRCYHGYVSTTLTVPRLVEQGFHRLMVRMCLLLGT